MALARTVAVVFVVLVAFPAAAQNRNLKVAGFVTALGSGFFIGLGVIEHKTEDCLPGWSRVRNPLPGGGALCIDDQPVPRRYQPETKSRLRSKAMLGVGLAGVGAGIVLMVLPDSVRVVQVEAEPDRMLFSRSISW